MARSSSQSISANTPTIISWTSEVADTDAWHDNSVNPSRLTVPSGVTHVRLTGNVRSSSASGWLRARILKNGAAFNGMGQDGSDTAGTDAVNLCTGILAVSAGDYFEVEVTDSTAITVSDDALQTWFSIEEVRL